MTMPSTRNRPPAQTNPPQEFHFDWGGVGFKVLQPDPGFEFNETSWGVGGDRQGQGEGVSPIFINDLTGGLRSTKAIVDWATEARTFYYRNTGIYGLWLPEGIGVKSYLITTQTDVVSVDHSTFNSGNKRVHGVMWPTSSGLRFIAGALAQIYKDTSVSDPAIVVPSTADNVTDDIYGMSVGKFGSSTVLAIVTDGQTDDAKYTTDPTADSITWTSLVTYPNANDRGYWLYYVPTLGDGGRWILCAKLNNGTPALYSFKPSDTAPLTISTMQPVVFEASKDEEGSIATVTTSEISPSVFGQEGQGDTDPSTTTGASLFPGIWVNLTNAASDDSAYTDYELNVTDFDVGGSDWTGLTSYFISGGYSHGVPKAALIQGIAAVINAKHTDANSAFTINFADAVLRVRGGQVGDGRSTGQDIGTADEDVSLGSSTDSWGARLTGADLDYLSVAQRFSIIADATSETRTGSVNIDQAAALTITYRFPGTQVTTTEGPWSIGPMPSFPNFIPQIAPVSNDGTGTSTQRILEVFELLYDELDRVTVREVHRPETTLTYTKDMCHFQGGVSLAGSSTFSGQLKFVYTRREGAGWVTDNLNFPITHGAEQQDVYYMCAQDNDLIVGVCDSDGGDRQLWKFNFDTGWHPFGALQSVSGTAIASKPLLWAERTLNLEQNQAYAFYPNSTTSLYVAREFVPPDFNADPRLVNTSQSKTTNATRVTLLRTNYGPPELLKTLLSAEVQNDEVDDGTTYDSLRVIFDKAGDFTLASAGFDHTFDASSETFSPFFARSNGLKFDTGIIGLEAGASTAAKTPNVLPVLLQFAGQYENDRTFALPLAPDQDIQDLVRRMESVKRASGPVRELVTPPGYAYFDQDGNRDLPAMFLRPVRSGNGWAFLFREVQGTTAAS